eukprot:scaffold210886_cov18-Prasinocladus_malaysianus.AAC.1
MVPHYGVSHSVLVEIIIKTSLTIQYSRRSRYYWLTDGVRDARRRGSDTVSGLQCCCGIDHPL